MIVLPITCDRSTPSWAMIELQGEIALAAGVAESCQRIGTLALSKSVSALSSVRP